MQGAKSSHRNRFFKLTFHESNEALHVKKSFSEKWCKSIILLILPALNYGMLLDTESRQDTIHGYDRQVSIFDRIVFILESKMDRQFN